MCFMKNISAGFTCLKDYSNASLLHIDFRLDRKDDAVQSLYAYEAITNKPLRNCKASTLDGGKTFQMRVTLITDINTQTVPSDACGVKVISWEGLFNFVVSTMLYVIFSK